ncbi:hypothetical protein [Pseudalkalibacillus berkeleyi]|uniref:Uncharacterized protein n=1 Tax=Pseudalkalibacillus berkeleyi TaxID=1069813 RepID=A0ABS9H1J9_9BACL|nr:hypothetical protein [Pseudalkalibacillus berkeleyi]MCF6138804.1 hypothetical protein [Pseudalkalibacillus berkeleyi]
MNSQKITIVLVEPGQSPQITTVPNDLNYFEELVDGPASVEQFFISGYRIVCSVDEGLGYETGRSLPNGTYFIARYHTSFEDMTVEEAGEVKKILRDRAKKRKKKGIFSIFSR